MPDILHNHQYTNLFTVVRKAKWVSNLVKIELNILCHFYWPAQLTNRDPNTQYEGYLLKITSSAWLRVVNTGQLFFCICFANINRLITFSPSCHSCRWTSSVLWCNCSPLTPDAWELSWRTNNRSQVNMALLKQSPSAVFMLFQN